MQESSDAHGFAGGDEGFCGGGVVFEAFVFVLELLRSVGVAECYA